MKKTLANTKHLLCMIAVVLMWTMLLTSMSLSVFAATTSRFNVFELSVDSSQNVEATATDTGWTVKLYGKTDSGCSGSTNSTVDATLTITNTGTKDDGSVRGVNFNITTTGMKTNDTNAAKELNASANSISYTATSGNGSSAFTTVTIDIKDVVQEALGTQIDTIVNPGVNGKVFVDGVEITEVTTITNGDDKMYTLTAEPAEGYEFFGWFIGNEPLTIQGETTFTYPGTKAQTLTPRFIKAGSAIYVLKGASPVIYYDFLDQAISAAGSSGTVVVAKNGKAFSSDGSNAFTIPNGVTLLVPYDAQYTVIKDNMKDNVYGPHTVRPAKVPFRGLTLTENASITVQSGGNLIVGAQAHNFMVGQVGPYGYITMDEGSNITLQSGSNLFAWGYIFYGTGNGGTVTVESGAKVYEPLYTMDYTGDAGQANSRYSEGVFPVRSFGFVNVEVPMTVQYGGSVYVFYHIYGDLVGSHAGNILFMGSSSNAPFQTKDSTGSWTVGYKNSRQFVRSNGNVALNSVKLSIKYIVEINMDSSKTSGLPMGSFYDVYIDSGTVTANDNLVLMAGSRTTVDKDATVNMNGKSLYVLAASDDPGTGASAKEAGEEDVHGNYPGAVTGIDAVIDVNGKMIANGGFYTSTGFTTDTCPITSSQKTGVIEVAGTSTKTSVKIKIDQNATKDVPIAPASLKHGSGGALLIREDTFSYNAETDKWVPSGHVIADDAWAVTPATCTTDGSKTGTCTHCGEVVVDVIPAPGHNMAAATCTEPATCMAEGCGYTEGEPHGHNWLDPSCTQPSVCTYACGTVIDEPLGHDFEELSRTESSCTTDGAIEKRCYRCAYSETETLPALGHTPVGEWLTNDENTKHYKDCEVCDEPAEEAIHSGGTATCIAAKVCEVCQISYGTVDTDNGHTWNETTYKFADDGKSCTAQRTCKTDSAHVETANATISSSVKETANCSKVGTTTYTATFDLPWATEQTKDVADIPVDASAHADANTDHICDHGCGKSDIGAHEDTIGDQNHVCDYCNSKEQLSDCTPGAAVIENKTAATCTVPGSYDSVIYCSECGVQMSRETVAIEKVAHSYEAVVTAPTCEAGGYTTYTCSACGDSYMDNYVDATGHNYSVEQSRTEATCVATGSVIKKCTNCDSTTTETLPINSDNHTDKNSTVNAKEADCVNAGYTGDTVCECGVTVATGTEIPAKGHTASAAVEENRVEASCTATGSYDSVVYCSACGSELSRENKTIEKIAHTPAEAVREKEVAATCYTEGSYEEVVYCSVEGCGAEISRETKSVEKIAHTPAEAVREKEVAATCYAEGSYDEVVYCSVEGCKAEISRTEKTIEKIAHTPGEAVREREVAATCYAEGSYDEVVYCSVEACGAEISRTPKTIEKIAHTPGEAVREKEVAATCYAEGSYEEVVYCSVESCGAEISRETKSVEKIAHTPAEAVREKEVAATCYAEGSYEEVVYCSVEGCGAEISREIKSVEKIAHTPAEAIRENEKAATCYAEGSYDEVIYCSVAECKHEISRTAQTIEKIAHTPAEAIRENEKAATCYAEGSYDEVVYCSVEECKHEISRTAHTIEKIAHTPAEVIRENEKAATCYAEGSYDEVIYCSICDAEVSRKTITVDALDHDWDDPTYNFAENGKGCTAERICKNDKTHIETAKAEITSAVKIPATCEDKGTTTYTATFVVEWAVNQTKDVVDIEAIGHEFEYFVGKSEDCGNDGHLSYEYCKNCDRYHDLYTGLWIFDLEAWKVGDGKIPATGEHSYYAVNFVWGDDNKTCSVEGACSCGHATKTVNAEVTTKVVKEPTCTSMGTTEYIAVVVDTEDNWSAGAQNKFVEDIPATGEHIYTTYVANGKGFETASCDYGCGTAHTRVEPELGEGDQVEVEIPEPEEGQTTTNVTLDTGVLADIKNKKVDLYLNSDLLELVFNNTAVGVIADKHKDNQNVSIVVEDKTAPVPEGQQPTNLVFDIHLAVDGEKVEHSDFGTGSVTVTIPLDSFGDLTGKMVKVWYLSGDEPEEMEAIFDNNAKKVKFLTHHFSEYKIEVVDAETDTSVEVAFNNMAEGSATINAPETGAVGKDYTFSVTCDKACVVLAKDANGEYTRLPALGDGNTRSFVVTLAEGMEIVVAIKGDVTGDGTINVFDRLAIAKGTLSPSNENYAELDALHVKIGDITGDGSFNVFDRLAIAKGTLSSSNDNYQAIAW